jgi:tetratricopeptide (TPR) repeat protein
MPDKSDLIREGLRLQAAGDWPGALERFRKALGRTGAPVSNSASAPFDLESARKALQELERAAAAGRKGPKLRSGFADVYLKLGNVLMTQDRPEDAAAAYGSATEASPGHAQAWYNLGLALQTLKRGGEAVAAYRRAVEIEPRGADAENNIGLILAEEGRNEEAVASFRRALAAKPDFVRAKVNLATALQRLNQLGEAAELLGEATREAPGDHRAYAALGNVHVARSELPQAQAAYARALEIDPGSPELRYNTALVHLIEGDFERGWEGYEARLETPKHREKFSFQGKRWRGGDPVAGRTLLVYAEQGLGDTLQFARYIPRLADTGAQVIFRVQESLRPLLADQWPGVRVVGASEPVPEHQFWCPLLSLPREFSTRLGSVPSAPSYLRAPEEKAAVWRQVFSSAPGLKVGLVWSGNPRHQYDHNRSVPLDVMVGIAEGMPAHFFALQKELRSGDAGRLPGLVGMTDLSGRLAGMDDTAAIVAGLDLLVTVDTSVAHLAGALGVRTWVLLQHAPDWRWLLRRADSPWYPSVRLFRQESLGDWGPVIRAVRSELPALAR